LFGTEGELMQKRLELIQPIQQKVFAAIEEYAAAKGIDMVIDTAQNATMLYYSKKADHTQAVIDLLKTK
jgi:outer membrane protein